jgi:hypothetical protein
MDSQWIANKGSSYDLHTMQLLQLHGGCRFVSTANLCHKITARYLSEDRHRKVMSFFFFFFFMLNKIYNYSLKIMQLYIILII